MNFPKAEELLNRVLEEKTFEQFYRGAKNIFEGKPVAQVIYTVQEPITPATIARYIDHTVLKPETTSEEIKRICNEANEYGFASVCVNPSFVSLSFELLKFSKTKICTVVGFPLGSTTTNIKRLETEEAIDSGAQEIDMVMNIGRLKEKDFEYVYDDIFQIANTTLQLNKISKVIIETCLLTDEEKVRACLIAKAAGANFVKTSTGFSKAGATIEDIELMRWVVGENMGVKASGGIRTYKDAEQMLKAGANRIGASSSVAIVNETIIGKDGY